jgi:hypothetical protein
MMPYPIPDKDWFAIRAAARRRDWDEVARRALEMGFPLLAKHARLTEKGDRHALATVIRGLLLDQPDGPDPFVDAQRGAHA